MNTKKQFQTDFVKGCICLLTIAIHVKGEKNKQADELLAEFIAPIAGNRNPETLEFSSLMPDVYKKVIQYCQGSVELAEEFDKDIHFS